jgi:transcription initiation factor TFIID subunit TAF12
MSSSSGAGRFNKSHTLDDNKRIQKMLTELKSKHPDRRGDPPHIVMDEVVKRMMIDYANELTLSVLEAASMMAKHRNADCIEVDDVKIILGEYNSISILASAH